jgi:hypothetical protein
MWRFNMARLSELNGRVLRLYAGATSVVAEYSGSNDEGCVDTPYIMGSDGWEFNGQDLDDKMSREYEGFVYDILEGSHPGWEINEGSKGTVVFDLNTGKATINHADRQILIVDCEPEEVEID